jgi:hypothetical protein
VTVQVEPAAAAVAQLIWVPLVVQVDEAALGVTVIRLQVVFALE